MLYLLTLLYDIIYMGDFMPSLITHYIFADKLLNKLEHQINKEKDLFHIFAQSHDLLFYYFSLNLKEKRRINSFGHKAHHSKTQAYLINIIETIKEYHLEYYEPALAYLYGVITHYVLDTTCHPYIFYKTGCCYEDDKSTYKYKGEHTFIEKNLDAYYYTKYFKKDFQKCNISKTIIKKPQISNELEQLISIAYQKTYNQKDIGKYIKKGIKYCKLFHTLVVNDRFGIKIKIYQKLKNIIKTPDLPAYSTAIKINKNYLNENHQQWNNPCNKEMVYNYSFDDLLNLSLKKCLKIINEIDKYLFEDNSINNVKKVIPNISYSNGLDLKNYTRMCYFEY